MLVSVHSLSYIQQNASMYPSTHSDLHLISCEYIWPHICTYSMIWISLSSFRYVSICENSWVYMWHNMEQYVTTDLHLCMHMYMYLMWSHTSAYVHAQGCTLLFTGLILSVFNLGRTQGNKFLCSKGHGLESLS